MLLHSWSFRAHIRMVTRISAFTLVLLASAHAHAQNAQLSGIIRDEAKASVASAQIKLENEATHVHWETRSNKDGAYLLPSIQPGNYQVTVQSPGFEQQIIHGFKLEVSGKVTLDVALHIGSDSQSVTVSGGSSQINTTDASVSTVVDQEFVQNMPLNGRSFQSLLTLVPGVSVVPSNGAGQSGEMTVNGQRTEANYFTVDGVSANTGSGVSTPGYGAGYSGSIAGETQLGTTQSIVPIDALQEFRATTSTYSAEYGRTPGGQFSFNTRSGTSQLHGSAYDYFRNDALDANNWFNKRSQLARTRERQNDFGGTLNGPIFIPGLYNGIDRSFFFFAYEGLRLSSPQAATTIEVPGVDLRNNAGTATLRQLLNGFPLPTSGGRTDGLAYTTAAYSLPSKLDNISIRGDHHFNDRFSIFGRYATTPSSGQTRSTSNLAQVTNAAINIKSITLGATNILTPSLANEARFNLTWNDSSSRYHVDDFGGATALDYKSLNMPGLGATDWLFMYLWDQYPAVRIQPSTNHQRQINLVDSMTWTVARHNFKWGVDYREILTRFPLAANYQTASYASQAAVESPTTSLITVYSAGITAQPRFRNLGLYVQDEWKTTTRLSLSLGLRWDLNPAPVDAGGNQPYALTSTDVATLKLASRGEPLWKTTYGNFAPRVGVAYQLSNKAGHQIVLRAGYGLFYDLGSSEATRGYWYATGITNYATFSNTAFPLTQAQLDSIPAPNTNTPYTRIIAGYDPNLKLPRTQQWNVALEQALGSNQTVKFNYVGSSGSQLTTQKQYYPARSGNTNFSSNAFLYLTRNGSSSNYNAMQLSYQRRIALGLQALISYTWARAIDDATSNFQITSQQRADSDIDIRNNFQAAVTYELPSNYSHRAMAMAFGHWAVDSRTFARSALPVDIVTSTSVVDSTGSTVSYHPNRVVGEPLYVSNTTAPGGRLINYKAFTAAYATGTSTVTEGNAGRNSARAFSAVQTDLAIRREFKFTDRFGMQFRVEAFNLLNHANFGNIYNRLSYGNDTSSLTQFGIGYNLMSSQLGGLNSLYQSGGPRSLQVALKLQF